MCRRAARVLPVIVCVLALAAGATVGMASVSPAAARPQAAAATVRVATKPLVPFVERRGDGSVVGFSIELWDEIARRNDWTTEWVWHDNVRDVLADVQDATVDAGIAGISMTTEREQVMDFSYPMFNSGLQVLVPRASDSHFLDTARDLFATTLRILLALGALTLVAAHVMWLINRRKTDWPAGYARGVGHGWWIAVSTLLANDPGEPRRLVGRVVSILWVLTGIVFVAYFTANLASERTVESIQGTIRSIDDLPGKRVVTVDGTTSASELTARGIAFAAVGSIDDAYGELLGGRADAVVYDSPVLLYYASHEGRGRVSVVGSVFKPEPYGIALPTGSAFREAINNSLLELQADGYYQQLYDRYFRATSTG